MRAPALPACGIGLGFALLVEPLAAFVRTACAADFGEEAVPEPPLWVRLRGLLLRGLASALEVFFGVAGAVFFAAMVRGVIAPVGLSLRQQCRVQDWLAAGAVAALAPFRRALLPT